MSDVRSIKSNLSMQRWAAIIADRNSTELTVDEYCIQNNLSRNSYYYWLRKLREEIAGSVLSTNSPGNASEKTEHRMVELMPSCDAEVTVPLVPIAVSREEMISRESETLKISVGDINVHAGINTSDELLLKVIRVIRNA